MLLILSISRWDFYPRPPRGGRPSLAAPLLSYCYFYPRPPRGGRRKSIGKHEITYVISIHALREEGDLLGRDAYHAQMTISIHALREEGDGRTVSPKIPPC